MTFLYLGIPLAIFAFILYKSYTKPIYFTLLPWVVGLGRAIFIDILPDTVVANISSFQISVQDLLFGLVVIAWGYSCLRRKSSGHLWAHSGIWIGLLWSLFLIIEALISITDPSIHIGPRALIDMRFWFYFPLSFLLFVDMYRRYSRDEFLEALGVFSLIVAGITMFYILDSGLGWKIYPYEKYYQDVVGGVLITRDFTTFSLFWLGLVFSYLLVMPRSLMKSLVLLALISVGVFFSYTRFFIIGMALIFVFAGILLLIKSLLQAWGKNAIKREHISSKKEIFLPAHSQDKTVSTITSRRSVLLIFFVVLPGLAALLLTILPVILPEQWNFLAERFLDTQNVGSQGVSAFPNIVIRWNYFTSAQSDGMNFNPWLGNGLIMHSGVFPWMSYDSDWIHLVFRFGIVGVVVFMLPLIWAQWIMLTAFFARHEKTAERLALLILLFNVFVFLQRFAGIIYLWWYPISTLGIALATVEANQLWYKAERSISINTGMNLNWFVQNDHYWFIRRLTLLFIILFINVLFLRWVLR